MQRHVRIIGLLYFLCGASMVLLGLVVLLMFGGAGLVGWGAAGSGDVPPIVIPIAGAVGGVFFFLLCLLAIPAIVAGVGLLKRRPWSRVLTIILSGIVLFLWPVGTMLGIYFLWVLLSKKTEPVFLRHGSG